MGLIHGQQTPQAAQTESFRRKSEKLRQCLRLAWSRCWKLAAYRVLSRAAHQILSRLEVELSHHRGKENGHLICTHGDFGKYGVHRNSVGPAIRELKALGFVEVTLKGRGGNGGFGIPFPISADIRPTDDEEPTHEWRRIKTVEQAIEVASVARSTAPKKRKTARGKRTDFGREKRPEKTSAPVMDSANPDQYESATTVYIWGRGEGLRVGKARSCREPLTPCRPSERSDQEEARRRSKHRPKRLSVSVDHTSERFGEDHHVQRGRPSNSDFASCCRFGRSTNSSLLLVGTEEELGRKQNEIDPVCSVRRQGTRALLGGRPTCKQRRRTQRFRATRS